MLENSFPSSQISITWGRCMKCQLICILFQQFCLFSLSELLGKMSSPLQPVTFHNSSVYSNECYKPHSHGRCIPMCYMEVSCISSVTKPSRKRGMVLFSEHKEAHIQTETFAHFQIADCQASKNFTKKLIVGSIGEYYWDSH